MIISAARRRRTVAVVLACLKLASAVPADAGESACPGTRAQIDGIGSVHRAHVCSAASFAEARLAKCGIAPRRSYVVRFVPEVRNAYGHCIFGQFRAGEMDVAAIVDPETAASLVAEIREDDPMNVYKKLPASEFHWSLLAHEISHAIVHQNLAVAPCSAVHEYVASVAQLEALSDASRRTYLEAFAGQDTYATAMFNDIALAMNPARYAAAAYRHFMRPENGCAFVRRLLTEHDALPRLPQ